MVKIDDNKEKNKRYLELKLRQIRDKRMPQNSQHLILHKKHKDHTDIIDAYLELKKVSKKQILNPDDVLKNKQQYLPIVQELVRTYHGKEQYEKYYRLLLSSINI
jgi:hypothetical protein